MVNERKRLGPGWCGGVSPARRSVNSTASAVPGARAGVVVWEKREDEAATRPRSTTESGDRPASGGPHRKRPSSKYMEYSRSGGGDKLDRGLITIISRG